MVSDTPRWIRWRIQDVGNQCHDETGSDEVLNKDKIVAIWKEQDFEVLDDSEWETMSEGDAEFGIIPKVSCVTADIPTAINLGESAAYEYSQLPGTNKAPRRSYVRLFALAPGRENDTISCTLTVWPLELAPNYEAISYVWGDPTAKIGIRCSGQSLGITKSLHTALKHLRLQDRERMLWADAICINQGDVDERSSQVTIMKEIYSRAQCVLIWLGEETERDQGALRELNHLYEILSGLPEGAGRAISHSYGGDEWVSLLKRVAEGCRKEPVGYLLELPWFQRAWVIQEASIAKMAIIIHGRETILWDMFRFVAFKMKQYHLIPSWRNQYFEDTCQHVATTFDSNAHTELFTLLSCARNFCRSTDPRDRLYALLGLAQDTSITSVIPDYRKEPEQVFREFTISELQRGSLAHLSATTYLRDDPGGLRLPSWVPDWTRCVDPDPFTSFSALPFAASGATSPMLTINSHTNVLCIKGLVCGLIRKVIPKTFKDYGPDEGSSNHNTLLFLMNCHDIVFGLDCISKEFTRSDAYLGFCRALCSDIEFEGRPLSEIAVRLSTFYVEEVRNLAVEFLRSLPGVSRVEYQSPRESVVPFMDFVTQVLTWSQHRRLCVLGAGDIGWVPKKASVGDLVCLFYGAKVPHVLHPLPDGSFELLGECYLQNHMLGEALGKNLNERLFEIC